MALADAKSSPAQDTPAPLVLGLPLDCRPNVDCWIAQYMDDDPGSNALDYACGKRTYNNHNGTDFAIRDKRAMKDGVAVIAAADGIVARLRDGMADMGITNASRASVAGKECGNGVVLKHGNAWETQYCHLRQNSIVVHVGDRLAAGQKLGLVGMSGLTEFPHAHLTVRHEGKVVDPFIGVSRTASCGAGEHPLWHPDVAHTLAYEPFVIYNFGFADHVLPPAAARAGQSDWTLLPSSAPMIVFWTDTFDLVKNDVLAVGIRDPNGSVIVERREVLQADQARHFQLIGRRRGDRSWPVGTYIGEIVVTRPVGPDGSPFERRVARELEIR